MVVRGRWSKADAASTVARGPLFKLIAKRRLLSSSSCQNGSVMAAAASSISRKSARPSRSTVVEADDRDAGALGVCGCVRGECGQFVFGLVGAALDVGGLGGEKAGVEAGALVDGGPGESFSEGMVVAGPRRERPDSSSSALPPPPARRHDATCKVSSRRRAPVASITSANERANARWRRALMPRLTTSP